MLSKKILVLLFGVLFLVLAMPRIHSSAASLPMPCTGSQAEIETCIKNKCGEEAACTQLNIHAACALTSDSKACKQTACEHLVAKEKESCINYGGSVTVQTCGTPNLSNTTQNVSCNFTGTTKTVALNAVGDLVTWTAAEKIPLDEVGKIDTKATKEIPLPAHGKMARFSIIPTKGALANETIEILFVGFNMNKSLPSDAPATISKELGETKKLLPWANSAIKIYRRIAPEKQWTEIAMTESDASDPALLGSAHINFQADGTATVMTYKHKDAHTGEIITSKIMVPLGALF